MKTRLFSHLCFIAGVFLFATLAGTAQKAEIYPANWWTGMKWNQVQLLVHADGINEAAPVATISYPGVSLKKITRAESRNYVALDIAIAPSAKPGTFNIGITYGNKKINIPYELKARRAGNGKTYAQGITSSDLVYLLMPDRFANGDPSNDRITGYKDTVCDRSNPNAHHGGDLKGVADHLPYLHDLGVTSIWLCPVTENDMPWEQESSGGISGYHGYWITNQFKIDKRYGGESAYKNLVDNAHRQGMKIIQDAVYNHVGNQHFLFTDKPFADMFNNWPTYTGANHREEVLFSSYMDSADKAVQLAGWFTPHLPDMNLRNAYMANFLIQSSIWCTEEFGVDGWRVDTYKYCDENFMNKCNSALLADFPQITIFGEAWSNTVVGSSYFARNNMNVAFKHNLQGVTDFPMRSAMLAAVNQPFGWTDGANQLMMTLAQDILYEDPKRNCIFLDNHDVDRFLTAIGNDEKKYKMGLGLLLTIRGIPQLYYGTEIMMKNDDVQGDGKKRNDFPGGFPGDAQNKFSATGRTSAENDGFSFVSKLANFRKQSKALTVGTTIDYLPLDGVYVYFRKTKEQTVMCVLNTNDSNKQVDTRRFSATTKGFSKAKDVITDAEFGLSGDWTIPGKTIWVMELK